MLNIGADIFQLPIETGIFNNIQREDRIYKLCNSNQIGDEFHFILQCKSLSEERERLLKSIIMKIHPLKNVLSCSNSNRNTLHGL